MGRYCNSPVGKNRLMFTSQGQGLNLLFSSAKPLEPFLEATEWFSRQKSIQQKFIQDFAKIVDVTNFQGKTNLHVK